MSANLNAREGVRRLTRVASVILATAGFIFGINLSSNLITVIAVTICLSIGGWFAPVLVSRVTWYVIDGFKERKP